MKNFTVTITSNGKDYPAAPKDTCNCDGYILLANEGKRTAVVAQGQQAVMSIALGILDLDKDMDGTLLPALMIAITREMEANTPAQEGDIDVEH